MTSEGDLRRPGVPLTPVAPSPALTLAPLDTAQHRAVADVSPDKRLSVPGSPLMSPAKRTGSTLGPLGFYLPAFFFISPLPPPAAWAVKVCQVPPSDHVTSRSTHGLLRFPIELLEALSRFRLSVSISSAGHSSVRPGGPFLAAARRREVLATFKASSQRNLHT